MNIKESTIRTLHIRSWAFAAYLSVSTFTYANDQQYCEQEATTALEKTYCKIAQTSRANSLPAFHDFKKNAPSTQRLILKKHARALNIPLPQKSAGSAKKPAVRPTVTSQQTTQATTKRPRPAIQAEDTLAQCALNNAYIQCTGKRYSLVLNKQNSALSPGALTEKKPLRASS